MLKPLVEGADGFRVDSPVGGGRSSVLLRSAARAVGGRANNTHSQRSFVWLQVPLRDSKTGAGILQLRTMRDVKPDRPDPFADGAIVVTYYGGATPEDTRTAVRSIALTTRLSNGVKRAVRD